MCTSLCRHFLYSDDYIGKFYNAWKVVGSWFIKNGRQKAVIKDVKLYESMVKFGEMKITQVGESAVIILQELEPNFGFES